MTKLSALELLDKVHKCYSVRMLEAFREADLYSTLLEYYEVFPYNDIALKLISNIFAHTLDHKTAKVADKEEAAATESKRKGVPGVGLAWSMEEDKEENGEKTEETKESEHSEEGEGEQQRRDALLIYLLFETQLLNKITDLCQKQSRLKYTSTTNSTEMGYVAHLVRLGGMLVRVGEKNSLVQEFLYEHESWETFDKEFLKPRLELRKGHLLKEPNGKDKDNGFLGMFDDTDLADEGDEALESGKGGKKDEGGLEKTNQEDMDRLIQPCIDDDDEEEGGKKKGSQLPWMVPSYDDDTDDIFRDEDDGEMVLDENSKEEQPQYSLEKYFSNGDITRENRRRPAPADRRRYGGGSSDEELDKADSDDELDLERDGNPLSLEELDGWMNQVNKKMGEIERDELEDSLQDQGRVEEDEEDMYTSPMNDAKKNDP